MLELAKAISLLMTILALYPVLLAAFFEPNTNWQQCMISAALRLALAGCVAVIGGLVFTWPAKDNADARTEIWQTLPVRIYVCAAGLIAVLFFAEWYLRCGAAETGFRVRRDCL